MRWRLRQTRAEAPAAAAPAADQNPDPAARGARAEPLDPGSAPIGPFEQAASRFNASEAGRTVVGLVRTLGSPWVSVGASAGAPGEMRITVAWELTWYQWGVDLNDEGRPVFELAKGREIDELDSAAKHWNASAVEGGRIIVAAKKRPAAGGGTVGH